MDEHYIEVKIMDKETIRKYLAGELDNSEKERLLNWLKQNNENEILFSKLKNSQALVNHKFQNEIITKQNIDKELNIVQYNIKRSSQLQNNFNLKKINSNWWIAAAILLFIYGLATSYSIAKTRQQIEYNSITTQKGEKSKLTLSDGTTIWLNSESRVEYPTDVNRKYVEIKLKGEAFFDVIKNTKRKFVVKTESIDIAVTGTRFNVKSYENENSIEATLEKGEIIITGNIGNKKIKDPVVLKPNEQARFVRNRKQIEISSTTKKEIRTDETTPLNEYNITTEQNKPHPELQIQKNVTSELYTSWKDGKLMFKSESFKNLALKMERWFDVEITISDEKLKEKKFTGAFEKETIEQALKALSLSMPFKFNIDHNKISIFI